MPFVKSILCLMIIYLLGHVSLFLPTVSSPISQNLSLQTLAYAEEDEDEEDDEDLKDFKEVFINARILEEEGEEWAFNEGCLSIPDVREDVNRQEQIRIEYYDRDFNKQEKVFDGLKARVIQHEYDHIEGILFTDHLSPLRKRILKSRLSNISKGKLNVGYKMRFPK